MQKNISKGQFIKFDDLIALRPENEKQYLQVDFLMLLVKQQKPI